MEMAPSLDDWQYKIKHVFLLSKLSTISKYRVGNLRAYERLKKNDIRSQWSVEFMKDEMI